MERGLVVAIAGCQSVAESGGSYSGERGGSIGARYQRWICCSAVARLYFDGLVALSRTRGAVMAGSQLWLCCSVDVCLVGPIGMQTHWLC